MDPAYGVALTFVCAALDLITGIAMVLAILRIFTVSATLKKILQKLSEMDRHRRQEFEALAGDEE